jgi:hypothetical protein
MSRREHLERRIRALLLTFIAGLVLSGLTAFPLETELRWLTGVLGSADAGGISAWLVTVRDALVATNARYPFLAYGTDWLAFAHLVIAVAFVGPLRDPVRNVWVVTFGLIACAAVVPLALVAGAVRGIPLYWRLIDCTFGIGGAALLWPCRRAIRELETLAATGEQPSGERVPGVRSTPRRTAVLGLALLALASGGPGACASGGTTAGTGGSGDRAASNRTGPGAKEIVAKRAPSRLVAADGTVCEVSPIQYRDARVGDLVDCPDWRAMR